MPPPPSFFANFGQKHREDIRLDGARICLKFPHIDDYDNWQKLRQQNAQFLQPFEPTWPANCLSLHYYKNSLKYYRDSRENKTQFNFFVFSLVNGQLIGGISLGNVRSGVVQSAQIGYWCGEAFVGKGFMREALQLLIQYGFDQLHLNRLEAACIPSNTRSIALLKRCGFTGEGLLRSYIKINGQWQDHLLFSLLKSDPRI